MPVICLCETCGAHFVRPPSLVGRFCSRQCHHVSKYTKDPIAYFWGHVSKTDMCWLWTGERIPAGYGQVPRTFRARGVFGPEIKAHRIAWRLTHGPIPDGLLVLHRCDNPPCVNPDHLFLGTAQDNSLDREAKGRGNAPIGERAFGARFTAEIIRAIRERYAAGDVSMSALGAHYGVRSGHIEQIVNRRIWRHVA